MIKIIVEHFETKRDISGNVYHAVRVVNTRTGRAFVTRTPSRGNAVYDINQAFDPVVTMHVVDIPSGSARPSSLPGEAGGLEGDTEWRAALRGVGFKFKRD